LRPVGAGLSALERGERRRPHIENVRAHAAALDLTGATRDAFVGSARPAADNTAVDERNGRHPGLTALFSLEYP
jgi:hypothetical protein